MAQTVYLQIQILEKDIDNHEREMESFCYRLSHESKERYDSFSRYIDNLPGKVKTTERPNVLDNESTKMWKNICDTQEQISSILHENSLFVNELDGLSIMDAFIKNETEFDTELDL